MAHKIFIASCEILCCSKWTLVVACGLSCSKVCGILVPQPGTEVMSLILQGRFLTTQPPWKSWKGCLSSEASRWSEVDCGLSYSHSLWLFLALLVLMEAASVLWAAFWRGPHGKELRACGYQIQKKCDSVQQSEGPSLTLGMVIERGPSLTVLWDETEALANTLITVCERSWDRWLICIPDPQKLWGNKYCLKSLSWGVIYRTAGDDKRSSCVEHSPI